MPGKARWSVDPKTVKTAVGADGTVSISATVLDNGVPQVTPTVTITADRVLKVVVHGHPGAQISGFEAWSDL